MTKWGADNYQDGEIKEHEYRFKIFPSSHVLLSLHITQEEKEGTAEAGGPYIPPDYFTTDYSEKPSGSTIMAWLTLQNVDENLNFGLRFADGGEQHINYGKQKQLGQQAPIYVFVRNLPDSFTMSTNFDSATRTITRTSRDMKFLRPAGCPTVSITYEIFWQE
ncbi:hypothetical protein MTO96_002254 [Rhipicephalus appendiculatus]